MTFLFFNWISNSSFKRFRFYTCPWSTWMPAAPEPGAQIYFVFKYVKKTQKNMIFLFYKLISYSSNKKFRLFTCPEYTWKPAAPEPGAQFHFFLQICKKHNKLYFCITSRSLTLQIRNLGFYLSRVHLDACST